MTDCIACVAGGIMWVRDYSFGGGAVSDSTILQRLRRQISLDHYTIPPALQATDCMDRRVTSPTWSPTSM